MKFEDVVNLYEEKKKKYGADTYKYISEIFGEAKVIHKNDWLKNPTKKKDHEQSWKAFKGKNLEKLLVNIISDEVEAFGLKIVGGNALERTKSENLSKELSQVKRNLLIDYGEFGSHLPDVDIVIYEPKTAES